MLAIFCVIPNNWRERKGERKGEPAQPFHLFGDAKGNLIPVSSMWSSNYKKSTYKLNYVGKLANTESNQQMIHRRPTLQRLCPLSPWVDSVACGHVGSLDGSSARWLVRETIVGGTIVGVGSLGW